MLDEPKPTKDTFGFATGHWNSAPAVGRVVERIAPILGVKRAAFVPVIDPKSIPKQDELSGEER